MASTATEITHDFPPFFRVHKDGTIDRFGRQPEFAPPSDDPQSPVRSKDVLISPVTGVSARLYLPTTTTSPLPSPPQKKLPLLVYVHGGGFCLGSASSPKFHHFVTSLAAEASIAVVSVDYRLPPEHPLPIAWVFSHESGSGPDPWINDHVDFTRVFVGGESAGANIANNVAIRAGLGGLKFMGLVLVHPFFGGKEEDKMYKFMCPSSSGLADDPRLNPAADPGLPRMGCERVLFCVAEKDFLRDRGLGYYEALGKSGWVGEREIMESEGEGHGFHLFDPDCEKAAVLLKRVASFLNRV
ncbi:hypothetical protein RHSIM_Rhsim05G0082100 [Rhododendron simsii]|uniref:Alpha/beta hydrolase fold-3 domain-containing protein n=1 Tax=Rhododendron simsii TaxID=118357 RepID=A0A834H2H6_RHOSS|nr:hypothetical protein RHSIM_Rhsim05G0082100 [Rhododendron simsii]